MEKNKEKTGKIIIALSVYAVAMALVEAAVVVYLRQLYYPAGFFIRSVSDLIVMPNWISRVELGREAATIVMLASISFLAFARTRKRFWAFVWTFSIWDLAYYLFLYLFLAWPPSLSAIDVYFLIPLPWIGPVWIPLLLFSALAAISLRFIIKSNNIDGVILEHKS